MADLGIQNKGGKQATNVIPPSLLFAHLDFRVLKKIWKKSILFLSTSLPTLQNWSGKDPGTNKSSNRRLSH